MESQAYLFWKRYRRLLILSLTLLFFGYIYYFISTHGFVLISIKNADSTTKEMVLLSQDSNKSQKSNFQSTVRKFVRRGTYEASVRSSGKSVWVEFKANGFLRTTSVSTTLEQERARTFVADNPAACMSYGTQLISYSCGSDENVVNIHAHGSEVIPPYVTQGIDGIYGSIKAIVTTRNGVVAFIEQLSEDEENPSIRYSFVLLNSSTYQVSSPSIDLSTNLNSQTEYNATNYKGGILIYSKDYSSLNYFSTPFANKEVVEVPKLDKDLKAFDLQSNDSSLVLSFTNRDFTNSDSVSNINKDTRNVSVVFENNKPAQLYKYDGAWATVLPCGKAKLCATTPVGSKQQMTVYTISSGKPISTFSINNVNQIFNSGGNVLAVTNLGILRVNPNTGQGHYDISFFDDKFCGTGSSLNPSQYVICVTSSDGNHVLLIDTSRSDGNQINQRLTRLRSSSLLQKVIADEDRIYTVPDYGDPLLGSSGLATNLNSNTVRNIDRSVAKLVSEENLERLGFKIINVLQ